MSWQVKRISSNQERAAESVRKALEKVANEDKKGRGHRSAATAVEQALQAFGNINGQLIEIVVSGSISGSGEGYLTISLQTIDPDVMVV